MAKKKEKNKNHGPVSTMIFMIILTSVLSLILSSIGFQANKVELIGNNLEASVININNIISIKGFKYLIGNVITNFQHFDIMPILIISLIGVGIAEKSGYLKALFSPLKKIKFGFIIFLTVLLGIVSTIIGDYSYILLIPFIGVMYKSIDKNPILGIITMYLGVTLGYGTGLIYGYTDYTLGVLTEKAASATVDENYTFNLLSNLYIMIASTFIISYVMTLAINRFIVPKYSKKQIDEETEELIVSKKGLLFSFGAMILCLLIVVYFILDVNLPGAGLLLDKSGNRYIVKLFGDKSPFKEGIVMIFAIIMMICGFIYGKISKNIKSSHEYSLGLSKNFENLGFMFVLMFFISQLVAIIDWTNIGNVLTSFLTETLSNFKLSGIPLIIAFFVVTILASIFVPSVLTKWELMSPTIVPLFMRANITPDFTQFIFKIADCVGKSITPMFVYFIIIIAFLEKYRVDNKNQISVFGTLKIMMPVIMIIMFSWLIIICLWYLINFPIGVATYTTI